MDRRRFEREMIRARTMHDMGEREYYWEGYQRGLRRRFHGEKFGTPEEHVLWMGLIDDLDETRREKGRGYRDGFQEMA